MKKFKTILPILAAFLISSNITQAQDCSALAPIQFIKKNYDYP